MRSEIKDLFIREDYQSAVFKCKELLQDDPDNHELWYLLFLAENDNYININYDSLNNEMAFNKALDLANERVKNEYISEYNFYKNISSIPLMRELYRYAQFEMADEAIAVINRMDRAKHQLILDDKKGFYEYLYQAVSQTRKPDILNINAMITKLLYLITDDEECNEIVKNLYILAADRGNTNAAYEAAKILEEEGNITLAKKYYAMATNTEGSDDFVTKLKVADELKFSSDENNKNKAFDIFSDALDEYEFHARSGLAYCYYFGVGTKVDYSRAIRNAKAVIQEIENDEELKLPEGNIELVYRIAGLYYKHDYAKSKDLDLAIKYFTKGSNYSWISTTFLVECLIEASRFGEARKYIDELINNDKPAGYYFEGYCYLYGLGVSKNISSAYTFAKKALAIQEYGDAYALLYIICSTDSSFDRYNEKKSYMDKANDLGSQLMLRWGSAQVLNSNDVEDKKVFLDFLTTSYSYCEPNTISALADYHYDNRNYRQAFYYYEKLMNTSKKDYAAYSIGYMYEKGLYVNEDFTKAKEYYKKSSLPDAQDGLRRLSVGNSSSSTSNTVSDNGQSSTVKHKKKKASNWWAVGTIFFFQWMWIVMIVYLFKDRRVSKKIFKTYLFVIVIAVVMVLLIEYFNGTLV